MREPTTKNRLYERLVLKFIEIKNLFRQIEERMYEVERIVLEEGEDADTTPKTK